MKKVINNNDLLGLFAIILGVLLVVWGLSRFVFPIMVSILGFILISFGLQKRNLPPLKYWIINIITKLK